MTEDWLGCPALRHFVSESLETLGTVVVSGSRGQAPQLLDTLVRGPHLSPFLSSHFAPDITNSREIVSIYGRIVDLPDSDGSPLPFVLLSKFDLDGWLRLSPSAADRSAVVSLLGRALARTGHSPAADREMVHGLHRRHLDRLARTAWPSWPTRVPWRTTAVSCR